MNTRVRFICSLVLLVLATTLSISCRRQVATPSPTAVAEVGDLVITSEQLQQKLAERFRRSARAALTAADREAALEELVQFEALYAQAQRAGWHTNVELLAAFKRTVVSRFKDQELARLSAAPPSEAEIAAYYERQAAQFTTPAKLRGAILLLESPAKALPAKRSEAVVQAGALREQAVRETAGPAHFGELAQRYSVDQATRYAGGDFGLLTIADIDGRYGAASATALAALVSPGEVSPVVETPGGLVVLKLIERKPQSRRPLAQVRDGIIRQLIQARHAQAERDFLASARSGVEIRIHRALVDSIALPDRHGMPPALPAVQTTQARTSHEIATSN